VLSLLLAVLDLLLVVLAQHRTLLRHGPCLTAFSCPLLTRYLPEVAPLVLAVCMHSILPCCTWCWLLLCCSVQG
jgi:hypothetical protein